MPEPDGELLDIALREWRQGDFVVGETLAPFVCSPAHPISTAAKDVALNGDEAEVIGMEVPGWVVVSQTCDIVSPSSEREFVQLAPLVSLDETEMAEVRAGRRVHLGYLPGAEELGFAADLSVTWTVEKPVLIHGGPTRRTGCRTDAEVRRFAAVLQRSRARFAFPERFVRAVKGIRSHVLKKHDKPASPVGRALRGIREIRVLAEPSWSDENVKLTFYYIREEPSARIAQGLLGTEEDCRQEVKGLMGRFDQESYPSTQWLVLDLEDLNAVEYVSSDQLDFGHLSS